MCAQQIPRPRGPRRKENVEVVSRGFVDPPICLDWRIGLTQAFAPTRPLALALCFVSGVRSAVHVAARRGRGVRG